MRIVIVGIGAIGSRHAACLGRAGHEVVTVDRNGNADFERVAGISGLSDVDYWVVATPTATHLAVVTDILRRRPDARVLLEKPACYPAELADLARTLRRHPRCRVVVNDVYAYSEAVRRFAATVRRFGRSDPIRKITVEFTKNRELDVVHGRFVDTRYGEAGYEYFHMLSILRSLLPGRQYRSYLRTHPALITSEMRVRTVGADLPEIELYASSAGTIAFPGLAGFAFPASVAKRYLESSRIPYGADMRYRFADVEFSSGKHVTLVFEPCYGTPVDYKNNHVVYVRDAVSSDHYPISGNHFDDAVLRQLDLLRQADDGTALIRLAEHRFMADLSMAVSTGGASHDNFARQGSEE
ncbi:Gfo/Idh/MocA family oxidoreductase [Amycolatopsis anabasis]|uniref:Gfo/Idh/MocA family oxidoreductase n=1 Tax=Amycolatopsis anabasis TaxID=1840409 RepID=UPI00131AAF6E|nr:Gfo/Idh/MocA family oxidoreductase [Amycolatopsis anabasis]